MKLYPNYCRHAVGSGLGQISKNHFRSRLIDLCQHQLKLDGVEDEKDHRHGKFIRGLRLRTDADSDPPLLEQVFLPSDNLRQPQITSDNLADNRNPVIDNLDDPDNLLDDLKFNQQHITNLSDEEDQVVGSTNECVDKLDKGSSRLSEPSISGIGLSEEVVQGRLSSSEVVCDSQQPQIIDRVELIKRTDYEMGRIGWSASEGKNYLLSTYKVSSRKYLTDDQLLEFYQDLKRASHQPSPQTPAYEVGQFLQGKIPHPVTGMITLKGKVVEVDGDPQLQDKQGFTYPLAVIENIKPLSWEAYHDQ